MQRPTHLLLFCSALAFVSLKSDAVLPHAAGATAEEDAEEQHLVASSPLLQYVGMVETDQDPDGSAARELCKLHTSLSGIVGALENVLERKAGGIAMCGRSSLPLKRLVAARMKRNPK